jgi:hypothetical protein
MSAGVRTRMGLVVLLGAALCAAPGCSLFSKTTRADTPPEGQPAPAKPLRERGAQLADETRLQELVQGKTTKAEVRERFGIPQEIVLAPGLETYLYFREQSKGWISRVCERLEMLTVRFDPQGVLKDFEYRFAGQ